MLLLGFAMLAQRRVLTLINLFMMQGLVPVSYTHLDVYKRQVLASRT